MVEPYDVVRHLEAHQGNLSPAPSEASSVLLALPSPPLCSLLVPEAFTARRARALERLAEELGGGDGPLPIVDMDVDHRSIPEILSQLTQRGCRRLVLRGSDEQPGLARALFFRWNGPVETVEGPLRGDLAPLLQNGPCCHRLGEGVAFVADGIAPPPGTRTVLVARSGMPEPPLAGPPVAPEDSAVTWFPVAADPEGRLGPWIGFLPAAALLGTPRGARLRKAWALRWAELGDTQAVSKAALGLDPQLERRLVSEAQPPARMSEARPSAPQARVFVVTGLDGSGKTTHAQRLKAEIERRGGVAETLKIYRSGAFLELADELGARTRRGAPLAAFRASRGVKLLDSLRTFRDTLEPALSRCNAVVMDRYIETHIAAAESQLGWDLRRHPLLSLFPPADLAVWLRLPSETALARLRGRQEKLTADEHAVGLQGYADVFDELMDRDQDLVLDATAEEEHNAAAILERALGGWEPRQGSPSTNAVSSAKSSPMEAPAIPQAPPRYLSRGLSRGPVSVALGGAPWDRSLGGEVLELRAYLEERIGGGPCGEIPEAFWLEGYCAQMVLDLWVGAGSSPRLCLWPGALARMKIFRDLPMLAELDRLLSPLVQVESWSLGEGSVEKAFEVLGAAPEAARHFALAYRRHLMALAHEAGWGPI